MANHFLLTIVALASVASIFSSAYADSSANSPFIVAHKRVSQRQVKPDLERVSVSIDIYNTGSETAYDVTLTDTWDKAIFDTIIGNTSMTWERLDSDSIVSHSFELESKAKTVYYGAPALISYRVHRKLKPQEAYSTPILPLNLLADKASESKLEIAKRLYMNYSQHAAVVILILLFVHILTGPSKSTSGKKKKH